MLLPYYDMNKNFHQFSVIYLVWVGFPVPYIGFLSHQGPFFPMASPIVIPNHSEEKVLSLKKLPPVNFISNSFDSFDWCKR